MESCNDAAAGIVIIPLRARIMGQYSEPIETIKKRMKSAASSEEISNLCGLTKFRYEEIKAQKPNQTSCKTQKEAKEQGSQTLRTSDAWSRFMEASAPDAIRLSSHPKPRDSQKIGIRLSPHGNNSCAPWQSTAAKTNLIPERYDFMKREEAEKLGLQLQYEDEKPSHFEISEKLNNAVVTIQKQLRGFLSRRTAIQKTENQFQWRSPKNQNASDIKL